MYIIYIYIYLFNCVSSFFDHQLASRYFWSKHHGAAMPANSHELLGPNGRFAKSLAPHKPKQPFFVKLLGSTHPKKITCRITRQKLATSCNCFLTRCPLNPRSFVIWWPNDLKDRIKVLSMACGPDLLHISLASPALSSLLESRNSHGWELRQLGNWDHFSLAKPPEKTALNLKSPNWKWTSSSKPPFLGSMLIFQGG